MAGLGNPGFEYENTRHNVGFWFVDYLANVSGFPDFMPEGSCLICEGSLEGREVLLVKPMLYMNRSGQALTGLWRRRQFRVENLLVCYDDLALPLGKIRLRPGGSPGGHKGMESVLEALGSEFCPRLRFGIAGEQLPEDYSDYVLSPFETDQEKPLLDRFPDAAEAVRIFLSQGLEPAMERFNR